MVSRPDTLADLLVNVSPDVRALNPSLCGQQNVESDSQKAISGSAAGKPPQHPERDFMQEIIAWLEDRGWLVYHTHNSRFSQTGFPDLFCVRKNQAIALEVKAEGKPLRKGRVSKRGKWLPGQDEWLAALNHAGVKALAVWPMTWAEVQEVLK